MIGKIEGRGTSLLAWGIWGLALVIAGVGTVSAIISTGEEDFLFGGLFVLMPLGYCTVGALVARRHPRNPIGWLMLAVGLAFAVGGTAENVFARTTFLPAWIAVAQLSLPVALGSIPLILLLFPDGRLPSARWRPVAGALMGSVVAGVVGLMLRPGVIPGRGVPNPTGVLGLEGLAGALITIGGVGGVLGGLACIAGLVVRFRRSRGDERQQIRWLAYVGGTAAILFILTFLAGWVVPVVNEIAFLVLTFLLAFGIPIAVGAAILKYRLFDLDIVVRKTVVAGVLAAFGTVAYFLLVVGIPALLFGAHSSGGSANLIPFAAAAVLAIAFQPVRRAARRLADRLVYGKRASPYEVLSAFSERMGETYAVEDVLPRMARTIGEGTGAERAEVWLRVGGELRREGLWPEEAGTTESLTFDGTDVPPLSGVDLALPVRHRGELLGAIAVAMPRSDPLTPAGQKLVQDLASQAGLVLRNASLIEELRASRKRLVAAQDEERRRLERNIHDGAQQQLVALAVKLRLVETLASRDAEKAAAMAGQAKSELQEALEDLRDLARGIYPPLLADKGLTAALQAQARKSPVPVEVHPDGIGRFSPEVEAAVYFCVLEALQNAAKYSHASRVEVRLHAADGELRFEVTDDGRGFDPATIGPGSGLQNMHDRLEALGGSLEIRSAPAEGTSVAGRVPARGTEDVA